LLMSGPSSTEVELETRVTSASFTLPMPQEILNNVNLSRVEASRVTCVGFELDTPQTCPWAPATTGVEVTEPKDRRSVITVSSLRIPAGARVTLSKPSNGLSHRITVDAPPSQQLTLELAVRGTTLRTVRLTTPFVRKFDSIEPPSFVRLTLSPPFVLDLVPAPGTRIAISPIFPVSELALWENEDRLDVDRQEIRNMSSILSGSVFLESLNSKRIELRRFDQLRFAKSNGEVRTLTAESGTEGDSLLLRYHGHVEGMVRGTKEHATNLMPTNLELLASNGNLSMVWKSVVLIAAMIFGAIQLHAIRK
jgi:hypothetical protein